MKTGLRFLRLVNLCNLSIKGNSRQKLRQQVIIQHHDSKVTWVEILFFQQFATVLVIMTQYVIGIKTQCNVPIVVINRLFYGKHIQFEGQDLVIRFVDLVIFYVMTVLIFDI